MRNDNFKSKMKFWFATLLLPLVVGSIQCSALDDRKLTPPGESSGQAGHAGREAQGGNAVGGAAGVASGTGGSTNPVAQCTSGDVRCEDLVPQDCSDSGQWVARHAGCATGCLAGECVACVAGEAVCKDGAVQECEGGTWTTIELCANACEDEACVAACTEERLQCNANLLQKCVGGTYIDDTECEFSCHGGECTGECMPNTRRCSAGAPNESQTCSSEGAWGESSPCPADTFCVTGDCKPCQPGTTRCSDAGPQACSDAGEWVSQGACAAPLPACLNGACVSCTPAEKRCGNGSVEQCASDGGGWGVLETCGGQTPVCLETTKTCGRCTQGDIQCFNDTVQTCDDQGAWQATETCSGTTPRCVERACAQCNPATGERRCATPSSAQGCSVTGTWSSATTCSGDTPFCREDRNFSCGCEEGERRCRTTTIPEVCQGGSWVAQSACSGVLNHCLPDSGQCVDCVPGTTQCQSGTAYECTAQGAWRSLNSCAGPGINCGGCDIGESCQQNTDCSSGQCVNSRCAVCQPSQRRCQGNIPQLCSSEGAWANQTACTGATPECLASTGLCVQCLSGSRACGTCNGGTQSCTASNAWGTCANQPNLQSSNTHCGTCNTACGTGRSCQSGSCQCNSGTHACGTAAACHSNTDADRCGPSCQDCSAYHGTTNTCSNNQCACAVASLACGANVPTCSSWNFAGGTEGWRIGNYYTDASHGMTTGLSTVVTNGSPALAVSFDNRTDSGRWAAEFSVDLCPNAANVNLTNFSFQFDLYYRTTAGSRFGAGAQSVDVFLANGRSVILSCQSFVDPASDTWVPVTCATMPNSIANMTIILRFFQPWTGDIYIDNVRFVPK